MSRLLNVTAAGLVVGVLGTTIILTPFGKELEENLGLHVLFKMRGVRRAPPEVIVISLDKASADHLNLPTAPRKWPRSLHARLLNKLIDKNPAVIAFDMIFSDAISPEDDNLFAEAIHKAGNVVLGEWLKTDQVPVFDRAGAHTGNLKIEKSVPPIETLARSAAASAPFPLPKVPIKVNSYWAFKTGAGDLPTLPVVVYQIYAMQVYNEFIDLLLEFDADIVATLPASREAVMAKKYIKELIQLLKNYFEQNPLVLENLLKKLQGPLKTTADARKKKILVSLLRIYQSPERRYLNLYGPPGTIPTIPYYRVLEKNSSSLRVPEQIDLNGKVIFIGLSEQLRPEEKDGFHTVFSQPTGLDISGVEIAASAFANLLEDMPVEPLSLGWQLATVIFWGVLITVVSFAAPTFIAASGVTGLSLLYVIFIHFPFKHSGVWYPIIIPVFFQAPIAFLGTVFWKYYQANKERQNIRTAFEYYLPDNIVNQLAKDMSNIGSSSRVVYGTCLLTDAHQYTALSETMDPEELSSFMNQYYGVIFKPIRRNSGIVSDVKGDSILAIWATAHPEATARNLACTAALGITRAVEQFNRLFEARQLPIRIGIHSGYFSLGNVGALDHYEYRPMGDIVNTASRMEGLNKHLGTQIIVSEEVLDQLDGFFFRRLGKFILAGKTKPVEVCELISRLEEFDEKQRNFYRLFNQGLAAYQRRSWEEAIDLFNIVMQIKDSDGPSQFYLALSERHREEPPATGWDGTVYLNKK